MRNTFSFVGRIVCILVLSSVLVPVFAQEKQPEPSAAATKKAQAAPKAKRAKYPPRNLAPHVFQFINPYLDSTDIVSVHDCEPIAVKYPDYEWAKNLSYRQKIWYFDIEFKPMRVIVVDLPNPKD